MAEFDCDYNEDPDGYAKWLDEQSATSDAQELFACRYWYTWQTASKWPAGSVVLLRCKHGKRYFYSLVNDFNPAMRVVDGDEYLLINPPASHTTQP